MRRVEREPFDQNESERRYPSDQIYMFMMPICKCGDVGARPRSRVFDILKCGYL